VLSRQHNEKKQRENILQQIEAKTDKPASNSSHFISDISQFLHTLGGHRFGVM
jgi:hypothetical protein